MASREEAAPSDRTRRTALPSQAATAGQGRAKKAAKAVSSTAPAKTEAEEGRAARMRGKVDQRTRRQDRSRARTSTRSSSRSSRQLLLDERVALTGQAERLEDEANSLIEDVELGDVQFDDESGEGDTMVVERERDLALSAQARQMVADIDAALDQDRRTAPTATRSISGRPIPQERLEAIPWATELVEEKVGGLGRR